MKNIIISLLVVIFMSNSVLAHKLNGQAGIVLNSGEVRYIAKRHLFLSDKGFNNTYFETYNNQPYSELNKWLKHNNASKELIKMMNTSGAFKRYLNSGFLGFHICDFTKEQKRQMATIPEFKELMAKYRKKRKLTILKYTIGLPFVVVGALVVGIAVSDMTYEQQQEYFAQSKYKKDKYLLKESIDTLPQWLLTGFTYESATAKIDCIELTQSLLLRTAKHTQTDFNGKYKFNNVKNGFYYVSLLEPTTIYPNVVYWDEQVSINGNKTLDLYNENQNDIIISEINIATDYIKAKSEYMLNLMLSSNLNSDKYFSLKKNIFESLDKVKEKQL